MSSLEECEVSLSLWGIQIHGWSVGQNQVVGITHLILSSIHVCSLGRAKGQELGISDAQQDRQGQGTWS